jgi:uncharacterized protein (DUF849 family)
MLQTFFTRFTEAQLTSVLWWSKLLTILLPVVGAGAGFTAWTVGDRITTIKSQIDTTKTKRLEAAEADLINTRAELAEVKTKQLPRAITLDQQEKIVELFKKHRKPSVTIRYTSINPEISHYAQQIITLLKEAGCLVNAQAVTVLHAPPGLIIAVNDANHAPDVATELQPLLEELGINVTWKEWKSVPVGEFQMDIGEKPIE